MSPRRLAARLLALARGRRLDRELDDEVRAHLELAERDALAAGLPPDEARRAARLRFGNVEAVREAHRDARSARWIENLVRDVRYGLAAIRRQPGFSAIVIGVLALGIGANSAMFSLVDAVLLKPLPYPDADRIVRVFEAPSAGGYNSTTTGEFLEWRRQATAFEALSATRASLLTLSGRGEPTRVAGSAVTAGYFQVYGAVPAMGRLIGPRDDAPGAEPVVVLSHSAWQMYFGGAADALDQQMRLDGQPYRVIGVLPAGIFDRDEAAVWIPLVFQPAQRTSAMYHWLTVRGRLREGASVQQAMAQLRAADAAISPPALVNQPGRTIEVQRLDEWLVGDRLRRTVIVAFGAALLVLLIACANVANLLLARGMARRRELAVRAALGAGRGRLVAQLLTESLVLCAVGGAAGLALAYGLLDAAGPLVRDAVPSTADVRLDLRVVAFTAVTVVAVALGIGILPALQTRFDGLVGWLNQGARGSSGVHARVRRLIVVGEVALSLVLVCGAGLLLRSLLHLQAVEPGIRIAGVVAIDANLPENLYPTPDAAARAFAAIAERVEAAPGVRRAAFTSHLPLRWIGNGEGMQVGSGEIFGVRFKRVDPGYFDAFDIPVITGRGVTGRDTPGAPRVVVLNEPLAARVAEQAGVADPIGQLVQLTFPSYGRPDVGAGPFEVVGIIRAERVDVPGRPDPPVAYVPIAQIPTPAAKLIVRVDGDTASAMGGVREAVRQVAPGLPLGEVTTMEDVREGTFAGTTRPAWIIGAFAAVATLLATLGLYGVLSHMVAARRREIGIRMALGASPGALVSGILGGAGALLLGGTALGLVGAAALTRVLAGLLYEVSPLDPVALASACATMLALGLVAAYLPAIRAARVDPVTVLRDE